MAKPCRKNSLGYQAGDICYRDQRKLVQATFNHPKGWPPGGNTWLAHFCGAKFGETQSA